VTGLGVSRKRTWPEPKRGLQNQGIVLFEVGIWVLICNPIFVATFEQNELSVIQFFRFKSLIVDGT
jgi:hypothetical protein